MEEQGEPGNNDEQSAGDVPASSVSVGEIDAKRDSYNSDSDKENRMRDPLSTFEFWMIILTVSAIAVAGLTGAAIYWQAKIGADTLTEVKKGGTDTHDLAEAAKAQAENTAKQLLFSEQQAKAAQESVKAIQRQMRQDQRAWLEINFGTINWAINQPIQVQVELVNKGKTPAKKIWGHAFVEKVPIGQAPHFGKYVQRFATGYLAPNAPIRKWAFNSARENIFLLMSDSDIRELNEGRAIAVVHGIINYRDVFGTKHWLKFCDYTTAAAFMASEAIQKTAEPCVTYRDADDN